MDGPSFLAVARVCGFNFTDLTNRYFDEICAEALRLLRAYEAAHRPLLARVPRAYYGEVPLTSIFARTVVDIAREAQGTVRDLHRGRRKSDRMSAEELHAEERSLVELMTDTRPDDCVRRRYERLAAEPRLAPLYLRLGAEALAGRDAVNAVAFLRRASEMGAGSHAARLLAHAEALLPESA